MAWVRLTTRRFMRDFIDAGGHLSYFHRLGLHHPFLLSISPINRKIAICDGLVAFTGGVNITDTQDLRLNEDRYHDVHMRFNGPIVNWFETVFTEDWYYGKGWKWLNHLLKKRASWRALTRAQITNFLHTYPKARRAFILYNSSHQALKMSKRLFCVSWSSDASGTEAHLLNYTIWWISPLYSH